MTDAERPAFCTAHCFYCGALLAKQHEHDHFPVPRRHGGDRVVCACVNCHSLKDREPLDRWNPDAAEDVLLNLAARVEGATERIILAKFIAVLYDTERPLRNKRTSAALQLLKAEGVRLGGSVLGQRCFEATSEEGRRARARAIQLKDEKRSLRRIAAMLNEEGFKTMRGGVWAGETVRRLLARPHQQSVSLERPNAAA